MIQKIFISGFTFYIFRWTLRDYPEVDPIILYIFRWTLRDYPEVDPIILSVDESAEVTIRDLVESIVKAMDFRGNVVVF